MKTAGKKTNFFAKGLDCVLFRKARFHDVESMHQLINHYAEQGLMLARPRSIFYESLREFTLVEEQGAVIAVGGLHLVWDALAEIRALAVEPGFAKQGIGRQLIDSLLAEAKELGVKKVFTLTYQPGFFAKNGFYEIRKEDLPHKVWKECINCVKFPNCDEIAMMRDIGENG